MATTLWEEQNAVCKMVIVGTDQRVYQVAKQTMVTIEVEAGLHMCRAGVQKLLAHGRLLDRRKVGPSDFPTGQRRLGTESCRVAPQPKGRPVLIVYQHGISYNTVVPVVHYHHSSSEACGEQSPTYSFTLNPPLL